jgi:hypothetical protein
MHISNIISKKLIYYTDETSEWSGAEQMRVLGLLIILPVPVSFHTFLHISVCCSRLSGVLPLAKGFQIPLGLSE